MPPRMLNLDRIVNNFYYAINCLNIDRAKIYRTKYFDISDFKGFTDK